MQKGFLKDRFMIRNVLDIDLAAHKISIRSRCVAIILFDFTAALPSLSHDMMWDAVQVAGIDGDFIDVLRMFYQGNEHLLKLVGHYFVVSECTPECAKDALYQVSCLQSVSTYCLRGCKSISERTKLLAPSLTTSPSSSKIFGEQPRHCNDYLSSKKYPPCR